MELPKQVRLIRCETSTMETASFESLKHSRVSANDDIDKSWWKALETYGLIGDPKDEPDRTWDWRAICAQASNRRDHEIRCIRTVDKRVQSVVSYFVGKPSVLEPSERAVYIDRLATAPWNRGWMVRNPQYNRCGLGLIRFVVTHSYLLGLNGRVNLTAVAHVDFYLGLGFVETQVTNGDGTFYELSTDAALRLMEDRRETV